MVSEPQNFPAPPPPPPVTQAPQTLPTMLPYPAQYQRPGTSWWKYLLALIVGLIIATGGYFAATTLLSSSPEKMQATKPQNPTVALEKEYCSKFSGICFNYPQGFKVTEDETSSGTENSMEWYAVKLIDRDRAKLIGLIDSERYYEQYPCEESEFKNYPPVQVLESAPLKRKIEDENGQQITAHAVKLVVALKNNEGPGLVYAPLMYITTLEELFKPGNLPATCRVESAYSIDIGERSVYLAGSENDYDRVLTYKTPSEAKQQFNTKRHQLAWEILQTAHTK